MSGILLLQLASFEPLWAMGSQFLGTFLIAKRIPNQDTLQSTYKPCVSLGLFEDPPPHLEKPPHVSLRRCVLQGMRKTQGFVTQATLIPKP